MNEKDFMLVLSTCPDAEVAARLAETVVRNGLAACVNIVPGLRSIYIWNAALQCDEEVLLIMKTTAARFDSLRETLVALHPYEVPEVVALPVADGHHSYLQWVAAAVASPAAGTP